MEDYRGGMNALTERQRLTLEVITSFHAKHGWMPSMRDIRRALGLKSDQGVVKHLAALEKKGHIRRGRDENGRSIMRAITVLTPTPDA